MSGRLPPLASNSVAPAPGDPATQHPTGAAKDPEKGHEQPSLMRAGSGRLAGDGQKRRQVTYAIPVKELLTLAHQRGGISARFGDMLQDIDANGDGVVDGHELLHCMEKIVEEQKTRRLFFVLAIMSTVTTLITVAVILSLSVVIGERLKDTSVSGSVMTIKGSTEPIQVASSDMAVVNGVLFNRAPGNTSTYPSNSSSSTSSSGTALQVTSRLVQQDNCPLYYSTDDLLRADMFKVPLPSGASLYLRIKGFVTSSEPQPALTLFTEVGDIMLSNGCDTMTGDGINYLASKGWLTLSQGRHLLNTANLQFGTTFSDTPTGTKTTAKPPPAVTSYYG